MKKKIVYVDMDDVLCDFSGAYHAALKRTPEIMWPQSQVDFFRQLDPLPGAIKWFMELFNHPNLDVYILTAPSVYNPMCYMEKRLWVEDKFGMEVVEKLILSPNKSLFHGDYLIDDRPFGNGQDGFEGELIKFGSDTFPNWDAVGAYLLIKEMVE